MTQQAEPFKYDQRWLDTQLYTHVDGRKALLGLFSRHGLPERLLDVGCGDGYLVRVAGALGIHALGVDIAPDKEEHAPLYSILKRDLTEPLDLGPLGYVPQFFPMVISWEVAEHLPEWAADTFCDSLARYTGGALIFTAAVPGQGGDGHINCQPHQYWKDKFAQRGLVYAERETEELRAWWQASIKTCVWYWQNLMIFTRPGQQPQA